MSPAPRNTPPRSFPRQSLTSPPRPDPYEVLYNSAVQSFVRRDHAKTQSTLAQLLEMTQKLPREGDWYDLDHSKRDGTRLSGDEWVIKTLKLVISANASLYSDPPKSLDNMQTLLPPAPPNEMLKYIRDQCISTYGSMLPPQLVSTFLLAALKLRPAEPALAFAHKFVEEWIFDLPDSFMYTISSDSGRGRKNVEAAREGYLKVIELFVGEILGREGEWEMARGILDGEMVMGSKKKESLYRHLRALQTNRSNPTSPASSGILPSPSDSGILPSVPTTPTPKRNGKGKERSRASSASSSSSERTARPVAQVVDRALSAVRSVKGKSREVEVDEGSEAELPIPSKIYVRPPGSEAGSSRIPTSSSSHSVVNATLALFPASVRHRIDQIWRSGWLPSVLFPLPVLIVLLIVSKRLRRRREGTVDIRERLRRARVGGLLPWLALWLRWWADKFAGVWSLGTTITYM